MNWWGTRCHLSSSAGRPDDGMSSSSKPIKPLSSAPPLFLPQFCFFYFSSLYSRSCVFLCGALHGPSLFKCTRTYALSSTRWPLPEISIIDLHSCWFEDGSGTDRLSDLSLLPSRESICTAVAGPVAVKTIDGAPFIWCWYCMLYCTFFSYPVFHSRTHSPEGLDVFESKFNPVCRFPFRSCLCVYFLKKKPTTTIFPFARRAGTSP